MPDFSSGADAYDYYAPILQSRRRVDRARQESDYGIQVAGSQLKRKKRDVAKDKERTDEVYLSPYISRGLGNSGITREADKRYRKTILDLEADLQQDYEQEVQRYRLLLAQAEVDDVLERLLNDARFGTRRAAALEGYF